MTSFGMGILVVLCTLGGAWMVHQSWKTGESVTPWPMGPVTRENSPFLYWFDLSTYLAILVMGGYAGLMLLFEH